MTEGSSENPEAICKMVHSLLNSGIFDFLSLFGRHFNCPGSEFRVAISIQIQDTSINPPGTFIGTGTVLTIIFVFFKIPLNELSVEVSGILLKLLHKDKF